MKIRLMLTGILFFFSLFNTIAFAQQAGNYHLKIRFNLENHSMLGQATIELRKGEEWKLHTGGLHIQSIILKEEAGKSIPLPLPGTDTIHMYGSNKKQQLVINYSLEVPPGSTDNLISDQGIVLTSNWHPAMRKKYLFSVDAILPAGFKAITESDSPPEQKSGNRVTASFSQAVRAIHLAAGPYQISETFVREGLTVATWFFKEDQELSQEYLNSAKEYILRYEREIGPFPYTHYAIVSNRLPTGFGMPTFTLLGQMVLRLPFIKGTSLGHEIVHSWFGNSIDLAENSGNWCEGLTTYLADFSHAEAQGEGIKHRKAALVNYQSYVQADSAFALKDFHSASHNQPMAKIKRAMGYNRSAMFFHQLRGILGPEDFYMGLRTLAASFKWKDASWNDLQGIFESVSGQDLTLFFSQQLSYSDSPSIEIGKVYVEDKQDKSILHINIRQGSKLPYLLRLPIQVSTMTGNLFSIHQITEQESSISIPLTTPPISFIIDPGYDIFRTLYRSELPPVWSRFLGAENKLLIKGNQSSVDSLEPFMHLAEQRGWKIVEDSKVTNQQLSENALLFLGSKSSSYRSLFGNSVLQQKGFHLLVKNNPLNTQEVSVLVTSENKEETQAAVSRLKHYGKYSTLNFKNGKILDKETRRMEQGIEYQLTPLPMGSATSAMHPFEQIITELAQHQVIYLGERHDSVADHLLQLRILQELNKKGLDLVIGMEMFPASMQKVLDEYLLEETEMDEKSFLRASRWYTVWGQDYRLFRPISNFCRQHRIPIHGINIDREIVRTVFAKGNTDSLSNEQLQTVAKERDLAINGYVERLRTIHGFHGETTQKNKKGIAGFVQSQALWDESMAENIATILYDNPQKTLVVIAGSQHTRKDSGIPPRLLRRIDVRQASVLNIYGSNPPLNPGIQADYFFLVEPLALEAQGKIGVILSPKQAETGEQQLFIIGFSPIGNAETNGLKEGDILLSVDNQEVKNMEDIAIAMLDAPPGKMVQIKVLRKDPTGKKMEEELTVELSDLSKTGRHP